MTPPRAQVGVDVLLPHLAALVELGRDGLDDCVDIERSRRPVVRSRGRRRRRGLLLLAPGGDGKDLSQIQGWREADDAEIAKVGETHLVEVLEAETAVVNQVQLDAAMHGGKAAALVHTA